MLTHFISFSQYIVVILIIYFVFYRFSLDARVMPGTWILLLSYIKYTFYLFGIWRTLATLFFGRNKRWNNIEQWNTRERNKESGREKEVQAGSRLSMAPPVSMTQRQCTSGWRFSWIRSRDTLPAISQQLHFRIPDNNYRLGVRERYCARRAFARLFVCVVLIMTLRRQNKMIRSLFSLLHFSPVLLLLSGKGKLICSGR